MNKSIVYLICLMVLLFVGITGCGPQDETRTLPYTRYVESYDGARVPVPDHPKRILALSLSLIHISTGPGGGPVGNGGKANDGPGTQSGNSGTSDTEGSGYFDVSGYRASLDANKVMPAQAVRRGITGTVTIMVYFDGEGNYVTAEIKESSGSSLLDNDALALAARSGGATNTTGEPKSDIFYIRYELE